jgi:hypothetical protein
VTEVSVPAESTPAVETPAVETQPTSSAPVATVERVPGVHHREAHQGGLDQRFRVHSGLIDALGLKRFEGTGADESSEG